jgi:hypothetical protein
MDKFLVSAGIPLISKAGGVVEHGELPCKEKSTSNGTRFTISGAAQPLRSRVEHITNADLRMSGPPKISGQIAVTL